MEEGALGGFTNRTQLEQICSINRMKRAVLQRIMGCTCNNGAYATNTLPCKFLTSSGKDPSVRLYELQYCDKSESMEDANAKELKKQGFRLSNT